MTRVRDVSGAGNPALTPKHFPGVIAVPEVRPSVGRSPQALILYHIRSQSKVGPSGMAGSTPSCDDSWWEGKKKAGYARFVLSNTVIYPHQGRHFPRLRYEWLGMALFLVSTAVMLEVHYPSWAPELEKDFANLPLILGLLRYW